ncbi:hypothetical protein IU452_19255 [Nocardia transvalensis]|nr:hypothetical protein [Nocardia transvalensis]
MSVLLPEFGVGFEGFGQLVFENDDAAGCLERCAVVDQFAGAGGQA